MNLAQPRAATFLSRGLKKKPNPPSTTKSVQRKKKRMNHTHTGRERKTFLWWWMTQLDREQEEEEEDDINTAKKRWEEEPSLLVFFVLGAQKYPHPTPPKKKQPQYFLGRCFERLCQRIAFKRCEAICCSTDLKRCDSHLLKKKCFVLFFFLKFFWGSVCLVSFFPPPHPPSSSFFSDARSSISEGAAAGQGCQVRKAKKNFSLTKVNKDKCKTQLRFILINKFFWSFYRSF